MARYTGPKWKLSRRLGISLSETGKELAKRPYRPGQHGQERTKATEYGIQLAEKQKLRFMYELSEKQFKRTFVAANKMTGKQGENFMILLEQRLDNLVYRMGLARTRSAARQLVNHGHITVDGKKVDIASYRVKPGQIIGVKEKSKNLGVIADALAATKGTLDFVEFDSNKMEGTLKRLPERKELNTEINDALIVEYYNR